MITLIQKPVDIKKIELWGAGLIYGFVLLLLIARVADSNVNVVWTQYRYLFEENHLHYSYSKYFFFPMVARYTLYFFSFLLWNFVIIPSLIEKRKTTLMIILAVALFGAIWLFCGITDTWLKGYLFYHHTPEYVYNLVFKTNLIYAIWVTMMLTLYSLIKHVANYLLNNTDRIQSEYKMLTRDSIVALVLWMLLIFSLLLIDANIDIIGLVFVFVPVAIGLHGLSTYSLIPVTLAKGKRFMHYWAKVLMIVAAVSIPAGFILAVALRRHEAVFITLGFNAIFQLLVTTTFSWITYKRRMAGTAEILNLKTALGTSAANLDFLRSQINPHFLFNALNTLYGTAIQENADRTGEGIQRLGDMMRFMLQENMHEKILLNREVDYLNNYIALQKLRTQTSPDIDIDVQIEDYILGLQIAPMLLIPFIENAFKHGISLREPSHIKITLQTKENTLYFDVHNSIHTRPDNDPEKGKSGIGLVNVKQRLKLLYHNKHELIIRENASEFFIHLTINLT
ncbi:sensor histidine kinase [Mucilaginibacter gilvus]|uniref:Sensor histidine kinase n=1 Tax=Mucilaginibacter gilvus TaxID=2305909 RepID=A0A3S3Z2F7_9SPHI|nr:histidine kinase [Mucilaginibacter gilvus]RWY55728.1 sensor histidine kinase [Mucilaginibacter gilvus]